MTTPYTYLIGWPAHNTWYYGVRWRSNCDPSDLWTKYFTSSKYVKEFRSINGDPEIIEIRKVFKDPTDAKKWEHRVLNRMKADVNPIFLNRTIDNVPSMLGRRHSEETKKRIKESQLGRPKNPESIMKMRKSMTGKKHTEQARRNISEGHKGLKKSSECKAKISALRTGTYWWTDGTLNKSSKTSPGDNWRRGRTYKRKREPKLPFEDEQGLHPADFKKTRHS